MIFAPDGILINTGVPHLVVFTEDNSKTDMVTFGRTLRWSQAYAPDGVNVNLVSIRDGKLNVRTYERGVEDETLACGTGITASALCAALRSGLQKGKIPVRAKGGMLSVSFEKTEQGFGNIWLKGPVAYVFEGKFHG